jgi:hypothetical protein
VEARYHGIRGEAAEEEAAWASLADMGRDETNYANMLMEQGRLPQAEVMARRGVVSTPKSTVAHWNLAEVQVAQHHFAAADSTAALGPQNIGESNYRYWIEAGILTGKRDFDSGGCVPRFVRRARTFRTGQSWPAPSTCNAVGCGTGVPAGGNGPPLEALLLLLAEFRLTGDSASALTGLRPFLADAPGQARPRRVCGRHRRCSRMSVEWPTHRS